MLRPGTLLHGDVVVEPEPALEPQPDGFTMTSQCHLCSVAGSRWTARELLVRERLAAEW